MFKYLNRGISTPIAITIIVILAVIFVSGVFAYQYYYVPKQETKNLVVETPIEETPAETRIDETADWQTYTNAEYRFSFKYPSSLRITDYSKYQTSGEIYLYLSLNTENGIPVFSIMIIKNNLDEYLNELEKSSGWYEGVNFCENTSSVVDKIENATLGSLSAEKITLNLCMNRGPIGLPDKNTVQLFVERNNKSYILNISPIIYSKDQGSYYKILDIFLSTFKFTE